MSTYSSSSAYSSTSSAYSNSNSKNMSSGTSYNAQPASIAALPSFAHSLSSFPTMTSVTSDMVHYGTHGRTKQASEAKLNTALQSTKQRRGAYPHTLPSPLEEPQDEDDQALVIPRRKAKTSTTNA